jgi:hypothetical protein
VRPASSVVAELLRRLREERWIVDPATPGLAALRFEGRFEQLAAETGGAVIRGDSGVTEPLPPTITEAWLDEARRGGARLVWPVDEESTRWVFYPLSRTPQPTSRDWHRVRFALEVHLADEPFRPTDEGSEGVRFALRVCAPDAPPAATFNLELLRLVREVLGCDVGDLRS